MSELAIANSHFESSIPTGATNDASAFEAASMREKLLLLRDVMISLAMQLAFRAAILLRRWNY